MTTIIERDVHSSGDDSSASALTAVVSIIAIVVILGLFLYSFGFYPGAPARTNTQTPINIDVTAPANGN